MATWLSKSAQQPAGRRLPAHGPGQAALTRPGAPASVLDPSSNRGQGGLWPGSASSPRPAQCCSAAHRRPTIGAIDASTATRGARSARHPLTSPAQQVAGARSAALIRPRIGRGTAGPGTPGTLPPTPPAQFPAGRGAWGPTAARVAANWPRWPPAEAGKIERPRKLAVLVDLIHGGCCGIHRRCRAYCPCWCGIPISQLPPPPWHSKSPTTEAGHAAASAPKVRVQKTNHSTAARLTVVWLPTT